MRKISIVGIGAGHPDYVTMQAVDALGRAHVVFIPDKGTEKEELRRLRREICERFIAPGAVRFVEFATVPRPTGSPDYRAEVEDWHARTATLYAELLGTQLRDGETGAFLVWGDPSLYDSTARILEAIIRRGIMALDYEVIPGISSVQALAARHRVPLNGIGEAVRITTGRRLVGDPPDDAESVVVVLDGEQAFARLDRDDLDIYWGAYLGCGDEILVAGRLADVSDEIVRRRAEARRAKGWIMDTYLLRRRPEP